MNEGPSDLPIEDQIVRYVGPSLINADGTVDAWAFLLNVNRPDDSGLSVNWLDVFGCDKSHQLAQIRRLCRLKVKRNGRFAEMNVGEVKQEILKELESVCIVHKPLEPDGEFEADPSHAESWGFLQETLIRP